MVTSEARTSQHIFTLVRRTRWIHLAPVLALIALSAWAFASPVGAGPDDDYHIVSTWCASGGSTECTKGSYENSRIVPEAFRDVSCYAQDQARSAECQTASFEAGNGNPVETTRGNFAGEYPPIYYATMHIFAGSDLQVSALAMRLFNVVLFVGLATALAVLLPVGRRQTLLWGWLITLVPLGVFLIPSNNPSGWAIVGIGTAFLALLGWFESEGPRRWALGAIYVVGMLMVAGARGDAAIYAVGATVTVLILTAAPNRAWALSAVLPVAGVALAVAMFAAAGQSGVGLVGFTGGEGATVPVVSDVTGYEPALSGSSLAAYNLLMLPFLWTGVWGAWGLGWLDTQLPAIVAWAAVSAFVVVGFAGLGRLNWRKAISVAGTLLVLVALPVYVLTVGGDKVGANLQPRYLLPLIVLFAFLVIVEPSLGGARGRLRFTRLQTFTVLGALAIANLVALQVNIRRYVTGADQQGANLDAGAEWWWTGFPVGPTAVWLIGAIAYAGLLVLLWPELRRKVSASAAQPALSVALRR
ncbi:DUF2142 domain-containing protein [Homoserinimonas sp. A520]